MRRPRNQGYGEGEMSFAEIGRHLGFSQQRAFALYRSAMQKLRRSGRMIQLVALVNHKGRLRLRTPRTRHA